MNTKDELKRTLRYVRVRCLIILAVFLITSSIVYWAACRINILAIAIGLGVAYFIMLAVTCESLLRRLKELRSIKRLLKLLVCLVMVWSTTAVMLPPPPEPTARVQTQQQDGNPNVICEVIVVAVVVGVGTIIIVKLYQCVKKCLPPPNPPPTNAPPTNPTNHLLFNDLTSTTSAYELSADTSGMGWDDTSSTSNWVDWTGNLVTSTFGGIVSNFYTTNLDGSVATTNSYQSSSNLINWDPEWLCVTGWVSMAGYQTNVTTIIYDKYGQAFGTNWQAGSTATTIGVPIRSNHPAMFYRISP